jgi:hypothetical protein
MLTDPAFIDAVHALGIAIRTADQRVDVLWKNSCRAAGTFAFEFYGRENLAALNASPAVIPAAFFEVAARQDVEAKDPRVRMLTHVFCFSFRRKSGLVLLSAPPQNRIIATAAVAAINAPIMVNRPSRELPNRRLRAVLRG